MCEHARKLVAWLDRELDTDEALALEIHLQGCQQCREQLIEYQQVSNSFNDYCAMLATARAHRSTRGWVPAWAAAAAVLLLATAGVLFQGVLRKTTLAPSVPAPALQPAVSEQVTATPPSQRLPTAGQSIGSRRERRPVVPKTKRWTPPEPSIQVAIPAEAVFPPGAVPEGVSFTAVVNIGPDGLIQPVHFRPSMSRVEGGTNP